MKNENQNKRYVLGASFILLYVLIMATAFIIYRYYTALARGMLGVATMYLLFVFGKFSKVDISVDAMLLAPNRGRYFAITFVGGVVFFWATMQLVEMAFFFWGR